MRNVRYDLVGFAFVAGMVLAGVVPCLAPATGQSSAPSSKQSATTIDAKAFRVVDDNGTERAFLGLAEDGIVALRLGLGGNKTMAEVAVKKNGESMIRLIGINGDGQVVLACGPPGMMDSMLFVSDRDHGNIALNATKTGGLNITMTDQTSRTRAKLQQNATGEVSFSLFDRDGKPLERR